MDNTNAGDAAVGEAESVSPGLSPGTHAMTADAEAAGERVDRWLAVATGLSRSRLKQLIDEGAVSRDGTSLSDPSARVRPGQHFVIDVPEPREDRPVPQAIALTVVFEDEHLIVIDKPAGMVVHPAPGNRDATLVNALLAHCGPSLAGIGGVRRPGIVHRLDKDTSGLLVVAKDERTHESLSRDFAARTVERAYHAVVWGVPQPSEGEIEGPIGRSTQDRKKMAVVSHGGKAALTRYKVVKPFVAAASLVECRLATGRTHQIRVHLAARGHTLVGDQTYGRARSRRASLLREPGRTLALDFPRQALHAISLGFKHPLTGQALAFESALPEDMTALIASLAAAVT